MADGKLRQTAKISSLDSARAFFLIIAGLAVRQALLGTEFELWVRFFIISAFLFTVFRFSHGVAVVYEFEKKATETTTTPSSKKVELIFALFALEAVFLFLMSDTLADPSSLVLSASLLLIADLGYISISKALRDASIFRLLNPFYWAARWSTTERGTTPRTHLQWAISDVLLVIFLLVTYLRRPKFTEAITTGDFKADWSLAISFMLILAGVIDYRMNHEFYFGLKRYKRRKCVFVCSPLKPNTLDADEQKRQLANNVRQAQWYCRKSFLTGREIPFASHAFYPYFLDDNEVLDRKLGRKCALEFLAHCDAIYVYQDPKELSQGMSEELQFAKSYGLEIRWMVQERPPDDFLPVWTPLNYSPAGSSESSEIDLEQDWKKVFVCSPLHSIPNDATGPTQDVIKQNIRTAQWICHSLIRNKGEEGKMLAVFAPHAFYPYFTDYDQNQGPSWLESAIDILKICDSIYVYTNDGLEDNNFITPGMRRCIDEARSLGLEIKFRRMEVAPPEWKPASWEPAMRK